MTSNREHEKHAVATWIFFLKTEEKSRKLLSKEFFMVFLIHSADLINFRFQPHGEEVVLVVNVLNGIRRATQRIQIRRVTALINGNLKTIVPHQMTEIE